MRSFANFFLAAFAIDGVVSMLDVVARGAAEIAWFAVPREAIALGVFLLAPAVFVALALTRLPIAVLLPPTLATLWFAAWALPLPLLVAPERLEAAMVAAQLGVACFAFAQLRFTTGRWWIAGDGDNGFSARRLFGFAGVSAVLVPTIAVSYLFLGVMTVLERLTEGFVNFDLDGINIAERGYVRDDRQVHLVGMMHIGEQQAYDALFASFAGASTLVLEEGVTDRGAILKERLSYLGVANALGLDQQQSVAEFFEADEPESETPDWPVVLNADVDVSDFSPATISFLEETAVLWQLDSAVEMMRGLAAMEISQQDLAIIQNDIIAKRNEVVLSELVAGLDDYRRIIVPWGAMHLPGIAHELGALGFEITNTKQRRLVSWSTLAGSVF
jgi:hypothetical protein